jgi:hypothetical protein
MSVTHDDDVQRYDEETFARVRHALHTMGRLDKLLSKVESVLKEYPCAKAGDPVQPDVHEQAHSFRPGGGMGHTPLSSLATASQGGRTGMSSFYGRSASYRERDRVDDHQSSTNPFHSARGHPGHPHIGGGGGGGGGRYGNQHPTAPSIYNHHHNHTHSRSSSGLSSHHHHHHPTHGHGPNTGMRYSQPGGSISAQGRLGGGGERSWHRLPIITCDKPANLRKLTAALNKLTERNYPCILVTVRGCMTDRASPIQPRVAFQEILQQSTVQSCFAHTFARMAADLLDAMGDATSAREECVAAVTDFCESFIAFDFLDSLTDVSPDDYTAYCAAVKNKALLIGRCRTVLHMIGTGVCVSVTLDQLMSALLACFNHVMHPGQGSNTGPCMPQLELLLEFAMECRDTCLDCRWRDEWSDALRKLLSKMTQPRCRFKVMDILRM